MPPQLALAASSNSRRSQRSRCLRLRAVPDKTLTGSQIPKSSRDVGGEGEEKEQKEGTGLDVPVQAGGGAALAMASTNSCNQFPSESL